jgi:hypothetical protein
MTKLNEVYIQRDSNGNIYIDLAYYLSKVAQICDILGVDPQKEGALDICIERIGNMKLTIRRFVDDLKQYYTP